MSCIFWDPLKRSEDNTVRSHKFPVSVLPTCCILLTSQITTDPELPMKRRGRMVSGRTGFTSTAKSTIAGRVRLAGSSFMTSTISGMCSFAGYALYQWHPLSNTPNNAKHFVCVQVRLSNRIQPYWILWPRLALCNVDWVRIASMLQMSYFCHLFLTLRRNVTHVIPINARKLWNER